MSLCCFVQFSEIGGKCPCVVVGSFQKLEENVHMPFGQFSETGGKCLFAVLGSFQKLEAHFHVLFWGVFRNWRKMSVCYFVHFSEMEENVPSLWKHVLKLEENIPMSLETFF